MTKAYKEAEKEGSVIYRADAPFDKALESLRAKGIKYPISLKELAEARMQFPKNHSLTQSGSRTAEGYLYAKNIEPIIVRVSPLAEDIGLARQAIEANRQGRYFTTQDKELYEKYRAVAEKDNSEALFKRKAMILPSRTNFSISPSQAPEVFQFLFGNIGEEYLKFLGLDSLTFYLVSSNAVDSQEGTLLTQNWLGSLGDWSDLNGDDGDLGYDDRTRGVRSVGTGEASSKKISKPIIKRSEGELYSPRQISSALKRLKINGLEAKILEVLRKK